MSPLFQPRNKKKSASTPGGNQPREKRASGFVPFSVGIHGLG